MQIVQENSNLLSNFETKSQKFGISDMSLVMEILSKLYSNPIQTITQEYIANARDAHREIRQTKKIEVTAPSRFNPVLSIRDFGPGLSPERIETVFLFYGSSTKRKNNIQNGGFGIGAKSAWAYTDSFTIVSCVDGIKRRYIAHKSNGSGNLDKIPYQTTDTGEQLFNEPTNEPNGTLIEIAVQPHDVDKFKNAILRTVFFWAEREQPILKGFTPDELKKLVPEIDFDKYKEFKIYKQFPNFVSNAGDLVVIDGIPYPNRCDIPNLRKLIRQSFVLFLNTGDVTMLPSREEFTKDPKAIGFFNQLDASLTTKLKSYINEQVNNYPSLKDGLKHFVELSKKFDFDGKYKNYKIGNSGAIWIEETNNNSHWSNRVILGESFYWNRSKLKRQNFSELNVNSGNVFFDDLTDESAVKRMWRIKKQTLGNKRFILVKPELKYLADELGLENFSSIDASDYKANRVAKAAIKKQEICIHYFGNKLQAKQVNIADIDTTIVYAPIDGDLYKKRFSREENDIISYINSLDAIDFVFIADSYIPKIANNKHFIEYSEWIKNHKISDLSIKYKLKLLARDNVNFDKFKLIKDLVKDKCIKYFIDLAMFNPGNKVPFKVPLSLIDKTSKTYKHYESMLAESKHFDKKYPLLCNLSLYEEQLNNADFKNDLVNYLNSKHKKTSV